MRNVYNFSRLCEAFDEVYLRQPSLNVQQLSSTRQNTLHSVLIRAEIWNRLYQYLIPNKRGLATD